MRIWDQGLTPTVGEHSPATGLLRPGAGSTYGVEISNTEIDAELAGGAEVRHADCNGHGTHVASIAAGSGLGAGRPHRNVGVAPKAQIVMVKIFSQVEEIGPSFTIRFFDAVHYILNVARTQLGDLPVVINYSGGSSIGPHDGLEDDDIFLTELFRGATKKIFVTSAGNSAGAKTHARITIPVGGEINVPIDAFDTRRLKVDSTRCSLTSNTRAFLADFWYPDVAGVSVRLKTPVDPDFRATAVARGGPTFSDTFDGGKQFELSHASQSSIRPAEPSLVPPLAAVTVTRSRVLLAVGANGDDHAVGRYELQFSGPAGTVIEGWVGKSGPQGMRFVDPPPAGVVIRNVNDTVSSPAGARHVLTVGAYADEAVTIGGVAHAPGDIAFFSSRGVLIDYAGIGNFPDKPDLSGPGVEITAANSSTTIDPVFRNFYDIIDHYTKKSGTSMSAPHVAGTVALMMEKKSDLTVDEARTILTTAGQGVRVTPPPQDYGAGKLDAKGAVDNTP
jgi:subtilisin family serine protease